MKPGKYSVFMHPMVPGRYSPVMVLFMPAVAHRGESRRPLMAAVAHRGETRRPLVDRRHVLLAERDAYHINLESTHFRERELSLDRRNGCYSSPVSLPYSHKPLPSSL